MNATTPEAEPRKTRQFQNMPVTRLVEYQKRTGRKFSQIGLDMGVSPSAPGHWLSAGKMPVWAGHCIEMFERREGKAPSRHLVVVDCPHDKLDALKTVVGAVGAELVIVIAPRK